MKIQRFNLTDLKNNNIVTAIDFNGASKLRGGRKDDKGGSNDPDIDRIMKDDKGGSNDPDIDRVIYFG